MRGLVAGVLLVHDLHIALGGRGLEPPAGCGLVLRHALALVQRAGVVELAEHRVKQDAEQYDIGLQEFPGIHRHVTDAGLGRNGFRHDQDHPHETERIANADEDR